MLLYRMIRGGIFTFLKSTKSNNKTNKPNHYEISKTI